MGQRLDLQAILEDLLGSGNVYFQPPANVQMAYPCVVYERYIAKTQFGDGLPYIYDERYQVTVIDPDPDSEIPRKVAMLPKCNKNRFFAANNLNHDVFNLYY
jgi:hypothetical protein